MIEIKPLHQDMAETDKIIELGRELGFLGRFLMRFTPCKFSNVTHGGSTEMSVEYSIKGKKQNCSKIVLN